MITTRIWGGLLLVMAVFLVIGHLSGAEEADSTQRQWPMGSIGGRVHQVTTDGVPEAKSSALRIHWLTPGQAGEKSGLREGDILLGVNGKEFPLADGKAYKGERINAMVALGNELDKVSGTTGKLDFMVKRGPKQLVVTVTVPVNGSFSPQNFPFNCPKARMIYDAACAQMVKVSTKISNIPDKWGQSKRLTGGIGGLALLRHDNAAYRKKGEELLEVMCGFIENPKTASGSWHAAWMGVLACEYYQHKPSPKLLKLIERQATVCDKLIRESFAGWRADKQPLLGKPETTHYSPTWGLLGCHYVEFFPFAERCGVDMSPFKESWKEIYTHLTTKCQDSHGSIVYVRADSKGGDERDPGPFRTSFAALGAFHLKDAPVCRSAVGLTLETSNALHAKWVKRLGVDAPGSLLDSHTVHSIPLSNSLAAIASYDRQMFINVMRLYRWYYALTYEPDPTGSGPEWTMGHVPGESHNLGGDAYLNGESLYGPEVKHGRIISWLQNCCVAFTLAAMDERLSFYQNKPKEATKKAAPAPVSQNPPKAAPKPQTINPETLTRWQARFVKKLDASAKGGKRLKMSVQGQDYLVAAASDERLTVSTPGVQASQLPMPWSVVSPRDRLELAKQMVTDDDVEALLIAGAFNHAMGLLEQADAHFARAALIDPDAVKLARQELAVSLGEPPPSPQVK